MCDPLFISVQLRIKKIRYQISVLVTYIYCVVLVRNYTFFDMLNNPKFLKDMDNSSNTRLMGSEILHLYILRYYQCLYVSHRKLDCSMYYLFQNVYLCNKIYCIHRNFSILSSFLTLKLGLEKAACKGGFFRLVHAMETIYIFRYPIFR